ncbi:MAG: LCP family protein [Candidatus Gastranaerophilales bacterium]|nr:LCP family protein [Candidatus Gastranaerophilales bacterium]
MAELKNKDEQYSNLMRYKKNEEKEENKLVILFRILFVTFFVVAITTLVMFIITNYEDISTVWEGMTDKKIAGVKVDKKPDLTPSKFNFKMLSKYQNILLLGVDSNGPNTLPFSGVRSDTMIIVNVDMHSKSINAISIPRDSKVYIAEGHGIQKINSAYALGGVDLTKKTIEETLGIKIHNYVIVNAEGVRKLIDTIGGIPIHIDQNMYYHDFSAGLHIDLKKGDHVLTGEEAEGYLRFRKDSLGDIGRVHRQQKFIKALIEQVKSPEALRKIPEALKIASLYTRTDLNLYQMSQYAAAARDIDLNKVEFVMLPGGPNKKGMISYWILDPEKTQQVINRLIYRQKVEMSQDDISVGLMYPRAKEIEAMAIREQLKAQGYEVNCTGRSSQIFESQIVGYNTQVSNDMVKEMQKKIPEISKFHYVHNPVRGFCNTSDLVITLAND